MRHRRHGTPGDELRYPLFMVYLDLDELPGCFDGRPLWSARGPAVAWFRRADHLGDPRTPLAEAVRELVRERTGRKPDGPIRLLTHLRYFGHCFNPVSFYYCYDSDERDSGGERLSAVVAHVTNTPWGERHSYVLSVDEIADHGSTALVSGSSRKRLHVSPLMGMDHTYEWRVSEPAERLSVHIESHHDDSDDGAAFDATLSLRRRELSRGELTRALARYPFLTLRILTRIYGARVAVAPARRALFPHPRRPAPDERAVSA